MTQRQGFLLLSLTLSHGHEIVLGQLSPVPPVTALESRLVSNRVQTV